MMLFCGPASCYLTGDTVTLLRRISLIFRCGETGSGKWVTAQNDIGARTWVSSPWERRVLFVLFIKVVRNWSTVSDSKIVREKCHLPGKLVGWQAWLGSINHAAFVESGELARRTLHGDCWKGLGRCF